jgi:hypothetical protein
MAQRADIRTPASGKAPQLARILGFSLERKVNCLAIVNGLIPYLRRL